MFDVCVYFFEGYGDHLDLHVLTHSFPTRRSSDLATTSARIVDSPSAANRHSAVNKPTAFAMHANARRARSRSANARPRAWLAATCSATAPTTVATTNTATAPRAWSAATRSEEHTSELQSLMRTSYAVFCLNKKT